MLWLADLWALSTRLRVGVVLLERAFLLDIGRGVGALGCNIISICVDHTSYFTWGTSNRKLD